MEEAAEAPSQPVLLEALDEGVLTLTLNRPDRMNAFNVALHEALAAAVRRATSDEQCRVVLLTGAGKGFCAGQDLSDRAVAPCQRSPGSRRVDREALQPARSRSSRPAEADRLRGERRRRGRRREYRARLRHRARGEVGEVPAGLRADRPRARFRRHLDSSPSRRRSARPGADDARRSDRRRAGGSVGHDLSGGRRRSAHGRRARDRDAPRGRPDARLRPDEARLPRVVVEQPRRAARSRARPPARGRRCRRIYRGRAARSWRSGPSISARRRRDP